MVRHIYFHQIEGVEFIHDSHRKGQTSLSTLYIRVHARFVSYARTGLWIYLTGGESLLSAVIVGRTIGEWKMIRVF